MFAARSPSRRIRLQQTRAVSAWAAVISASILVLVFASSALAVSPVDMGTAHDYSVMATTLTSNGSTAMSDNLGVSPGMTFAGDTAPIVLGETHLGDTEAQAAMTSVNHAYGDAVTRPDGGPLPANLAGAVLAPGVYNTGAAMDFTASGTLTLDGQQDPNAVFIIQIGAALTVGASAQVKLVNQAQACNVFWTVGAATSIGASAKFAGTVLAGSNAIGLGAGSRLDGRLLTGGAVTLAGNAIRTACSPTIVVAGPTGPRGAQGVPGDIGATGPSGADGQDGDQGLTGATGSPGTDGAAGLTGLGGVNGLTGQNGLNGLQGLPGLAGLQGLAGIAGLDGVAGVTGTTGLTGLIGLAGAAGPPGLAGLQGLTGSTGPAGLSGSAGAAGVSPPADTTNLCVTDKASRRTVRRRGLVVWTIVVKNCGTRAATGVSVTDRLRKGATFKTRGGAGLVGGQLNWQTGILAPGARTTYQITTRVRAKAHAGRYVNSATAHGDNARPTTGSGSTTVKAHA